MEEGRAEGLMVPAGPEDECAVFCMTRRVPRCQTGEVIFCDGIWHAGLSHWHLCWLLCCCPWKVWEAAGCPQTPHLLNLADGWGNNLFYVKNGSPLPKPALDPPGIQTTTEAATHACQCPTNSYRHTRERNLDFSPPLTPHVCFWWPCHLLSNRHVDKSRYDDQTLP